jgi:hypothetical protein
LILRHWVLRKPIFGLRNNSSLSLTVLYQKYG